MTQFKLQAIADSTWNSRQGLFFNDFFSVILILGTSYFSSLYSLMVFALGHNPKLPNNF
jgi:hypothetical protein